MSPDNLILASGGQDKEIKLWYLKKKKPFKTLQGHKKAVSSVAFNPNRSRSLLASGSWDETIKIWHRKTWLVTFILGCFIIVFLAIASIIILAYFGLSGAFFELAIYIILILSGLGIIGQIVNSFGILTKGKYADWSLKTTISRPEIGGASYGSCGGCGSCGDCGGD